MKINAQSLLMKVSAGLLAGAAVIAALPVSHASSVRVYTNADLDALPAPQNTASTTAMPPAGAKKKGATAVPVWKEPIATQSAGVTTGESVNWDQIWAFIDRERAKEAERRDQELAYQASINPPERFDQCFFGECNGSVYRPGYLTYPGLVTRTFCLPCDFHN